MSRKKRNRKEPKFENRNSKFAADAHQYPVGASFESRIWASAALVEPKLEDVTRTDKSGIEKSSLCFSIVNPCLINANHPLSPSLGKEGNCALRSLAKEGNYTLPPRRRKGLGGGGDRILIAPHNHSSKEAVHGVQIRASAQAPLRIKEWDERRIGRFELCERDELVSR